MIRKYAARWTTAEERGRQPGVPNAVVEDVTFRPHETVCFASPMALAQRIAASLNFCARLNLDEVVAMSNVLTAATLNGELTSTREA